MTDTIPRKEAPRKLGGGWFHGTELLDGEEVQMEAQVFHKPSRSLQGGKLYLTNKRLVYLPDRWAAIIGDERVEWPLDQITEIGMTRDSNSEPVFRKDYLLVFECMYVQRGDERHLFSTRLPLTDREWVAAIKAAKAGASTPEPESEESLTEVPHAPAEEPPDEGQAPAQDLDPEAAAND
ncbi:MAG TPA: hypothetical protein VMR52_02685 [Dehalococcoidia bacterium]|nr:hypothetical protein [Dehalococcoidia bacterium]